MNIALSIAGSICLLLAIGHAAVGRRILPALRRDVMPSTFFGGRGTSLGMVRFTWRIVTVMLVAFATLLMVHAWWPIDNPQVLTLRWIAGFWLAATITVVWEGRRGLRDLMRLPMPYLFAATALLTWLAVP
jgi:hypothetical protein